MADGGLDPESARRYREEVDRASSSADSLRESLRDILFVERDFTDLAKGLTKELFNNSVQTAEVAAGFRKAATATKDIRVSVEGVIEGMVGTSELQKLGTKAREAELNIMVEQEQALDQIFSSIVDQEEKERILKGVREGSISSADLLLQYGRDLDDNQRELLDVYNQQSLEFKEQEKTLEEITERANNIEGAFGNTGAAAEVLEGALKKIGANKLNERLGISDAINNSKKFAANITKGGKETATMGDKFKVAKNFAGELGKNLMKSLGPAALIAIAIDQLIEAFKLIDGESGKIAKQLGVSAAEGRSLVRSANATANEFEDILVSGKDIVAAQLTLNQQFGTAVQFSGQIASEFAQISERTGLSAEAMGLFASNAMVTGGTIKDQLTDITATTLELNAQSGISLSFKEIQEGIAKASKSALLSAGRNTKELANQVYQAKLLGVEQSKVENIADSLLDFESSIAKELEAELLLGKDLNLEKARQAALDNDLGTVASEIAKQVGSAADFQKMNRIEAEALAAAVGMTREELAGALVNQENLVAVQKAGFKDVSTAQEAYNNALKEGNLTEELKNKLTKAGVLNQFESATAQEKLVAVTEKLQGLFVSLMEPLMPIFDILIQIIESAINPLIKALGPVFQILGDVLGEALKPIAKILAFVIGLVLKGLKPAFDLIQASVEYVRSILEGWMGVFEGIGMILKGDLSEGFELIGTSIMKMFKGLLGYLLDLVSVAINSMLTGVNLILNAIGSDPIEVNIKQMVLGEEDEEPGNTSSTQTSTQSPPTIGLATGGIVTSPTTALIGEGGEPEAVVPLSKASSVGFGENEKTIQLLERLVMAVEKGGIVELDGNKVGTALGLASYKT